MADIFKNEQQSVDGMISTIRQKISDYNARIIELNSLAGEISDSEEWIDEDLKPVFIEACQKYIDTYNKIITALSDNVNFMETTNQEVCILNNAYIRR